WPSLHGGLYVGIATTHAETCGHAMRWVARIRQLGEDVGRLTAGLDDLALQRRLVAGQWSLVELVCHLWVVQQLCEGRIDAMHARDVPAFESYAPENDASFA